MSVVRLRPAPLNNGDMGELVDPSRLERDAEMRVGSSPTILTNKYKQLQTT